MEQLRSEFLHSVLFRGWPGIFPHRSNEMPPLLRKIGDFAFSMVKKYIPFRKSAIPPPSGATDLSPGKVSQFSTVFTNCLCQMITKIVVLVAMFKNSSQNSLTVNSVQDGIKKIFRCRYYFGLKLKIYISMAPCIDQDYIQT